MQYKPANPTASGGKWAISKGEVPWIGGMGFTSLINQSISIVTIFFLEQGRKSMQSGSGSGQSAAHRPCGGEYH